MARISKWLRTRNKALQGMGMSLAEFEAESKIVMDSQHPAVWVAYAQKHSIKTLPQQGLPYFTRVKLACIIFMLSMVCESEEQFHQELDAAIAEGSKGQ